MITESIFKLIMPKNKDVKIWLPLINKYLPEMDITSPLRLSSFFSQVGHESLDMTVLKENLRYKKDGLLKVFPKYFVEATARKYENNPVEIANIVYANRMGNGDYNSGDGYKYRGRGCIMLTGKANYEALSIDMGLNKKYVYNPDQISEPEGALLAALWFWRKNKLNELADKSDMVKITKIINGGLIGLEDRMKRYKIIYDVLVRSADDTRSKNT